MASRAQSDAPRPQLILFAGVNGVGKSTFYCSDLWRTPETVGAMERINPDEILLQQGGDSSSSAAQVKAGREALRRIDACLTERRSFNQETTLSGRASASTVRRARELGYRIDLYYLGVDSPEIALKRIQHRVACGGHDIPQEDVMRRYQRSLENFFELAHLVDSAYVIDNTQRFTELLLWHKGALAWASDSYKQHPWLTDSLK